MNKPRPLVSKSLASIEDRHHRDSRVATESLTVQETQVKGPVSRRGLRGWDACSLPASRAPLPPADTGDP